jgi:hypothetical protein
MVSNRTSRRLVGFWAVGGLVIGAAATSARGDEPSMTTQTPETAETPSIVLGNAAPIADEVLGTESAKAQIQLDKLVVNDQDLEGKVGDNVAIGNQTGYNSVSGEAFGNAAGFATVIQNTGNNVLIQNSTIVNVAVEP